MTRPLRLHREAFHEDPALDVAVSRAILLRVAAGELPETIRITRPPAMVAFGRQDVASAPYLDAVDAARANGFEAIERLAGGRAAVFHERTLAIAHARPDDEPQAHIYPRFEEWSGLIAESLRKVGLDARVGEVPGEYCPGGYSVNARGQIKLAGIGQKLIKGAGHLGGVLVVGESARIRNVLVPVYDALGLEFIPATAGAVEDDLPSVSMDEVDEALMMELRTSYEVTEEPLDPETLDLARRLAPEHVAPATSSSP
ncbi:MAG TPA: lipoate--protein ligase family protein [Candidatus Dormibacteraeota bacterium]|nr:lipoate--protein ligase family protein [Candidatus Dormibacteraeota bacterium]